MVSSSVIDIFKTFTEDELKRFEDLIDSPFYNKNSIVVKLFSHLKKLAPEFNDEEIQKELIWEKVYGNKKFDYGLWKNHVYELNKLAEKFLHIRESEGKEFRYGLDLLNQFKKRGLNKQFERKFKSYSEKLDKSGISIDYYFYRLNYITLEQDYLGLQSTFKFKELINPAQSNKILKAYFFSLFFQQNYNYVCNNKLMQHSDDYSDLNNVFEFFFKSGNDEEFFPTILYKALKMELGSEDSENFYFELKKSFIENLFLLNPDTRYTIANCLGNYCLYRRMKGDKKFIPEHFEISRLMVENDFYHNELFEFIEHTFYYNTVALALELKEFAWCEKFINQFRNKLDPKKRDVYLNFSFSMLNEKQGKFDVALEYISKIQTSDPMEKAAIKRMELTYYYELGYFLEMNALIKNAAQFFKADKSMSSTLKKLYMNYFKALKKIVDVRLNYKVKNYDDHFFEELIHELEKTEIAHKKGILRMAEETRKVVLSKVT